MISVLCIHWQTSDIIGLCKLYANARSYFKIQTEGPSNESFVINTNYTEIIVNSSYKMLQMIQKNNINSLTEIIIYTFHFLPDYQC